MSPQLSLISFRPGAKDSLLSVCAPVRGFCSSDHSFLLSRITHTLIISGRDMRYNESMMRDLIDVAIAKLVLGALSADTATATNASCQRAAARDVRQTCKRMPDYRGHMLGASNCCNHAAVFMLRRLAADHLQGPLLSAAKYARARYSAVSPAKTVT